MFAESKGNNYRRKEMTKYNWERLQGSLQTKVNGYETTISLKERRRKTDGDKLSAKGKRKGQKIARVQGICENLEGQFMRTAFKANRAEQQRNAYRAHRAAKKAAKAARA